MFHATRAFAQVSARVMTKITIVTKSLASDILSIVVQNFVNLQKFPFFVSKSSVEKSINWECNLSNVTENILKNKSLNF